MKHTVVSMSVEEYQKILRAERFVWHLRRSFTTVFLLVIVASVIYLIRSSFF